MCREVGLGNVQSYIASGNVAFTSDQTKAAVKTGLEKKLGEYAGKSVGVFVRTASELRAVLDKNPFAGEEPKFTVAIFLDHKPPRDALTQATGQDDEVMSIGTREIYVHYGSGMGRSKLRIPAAKEGTARNMNTIRKMVELASN